jgi:hypothetical protein
MRSPITTDYHREEQKQAKAALKGRLDQPRGQGMNRRSFR